MELSYKLEKFEGPLDLLLHLIEKNKVNIYDIPITEITDQYMEYVRKMDEEDLDVVSEFLVMAATLLDIKARMLLRTPESKTSVSMPMAAASSANAPAVKQTSRTCCVLPRPSSKDKTCVLAPPTSPPEIKWMIFIKTPRAETCSCLFLCFRIKYPMRLLRKPVDIIVYFARRINQIQRYWRHT